MEARFPEAEIQLLRNHFWPHEAAKQQSPTDQVRRIS
jgi:hypothetical protein